MQSYDLYIFDLDDTLISTFSSITKRQYRRFAEIMGLRYPGEDIIRLHWGEKLSSSLENIFGTKIGEGEAVKILEQIYLEDPIKSVGGVQHILSILRKHKKFIGVYSAGHPSLIKSNIRNSLSHDDGMFDFIFSTVENNIEKPSPYIVFAMMNKFRQTRGYDLSLNRVLVVGDSISDLLTARNAGVDFAAVLTGPTTKDDFRKVRLEADRIFPSIMEALSPPHKHGIVSVIKNENGEYLFIRESRLGNPYYGHWSGPHGRCKKDDVIEEETVVRETYEECGVKVLPIKKLYTRDADTKVNTVSFWEVSLLEFELVLNNIGQNESDAMAWFTISDILNEKIPLYPGTKDFFNLLADIRG